ncbi:MAG: hypothetical protein EZS28_031924 [Streblomastix strix]|uniref:Uncharacterized protein n=1 Tax=Streblomastix strix TaxID=222440 RepID=A0A5J4UPY5_9EUKA|nr:MAG: hypothetical protein EZS28_031924 [Streblomastix strix]
MIQEIKLILLFNGVWVQVFGSVVFGQYLGFQVTGGIQGKTEGFGGRLIFGFGRTVLICQLGGITYV